MSEILLEAKGLFFNYEGVEALKGVDFRLEAGSKTALLGANGAGKSTLSLHLNGILRPKRGQVLLNGKPCGYSRKELLDWRRQVGLVLQNPDDQLFAATVEQDVSFGPLNQGLSEKEARERVDEALAAMDIEALRERPTHQLSFGQKKRAAIAGALAMRPSMLLLDEPAAGLDPQGSCEMLEALERLRLKGASILLATHDMDLAWEWADSVAVMGSGEMLAAGAPERLFSDGALLSKAGLRKPRVFEIGEELRKKGLLDGKSPLPRSIAELKEKLG